jgi:peptidoglycan/xylan/chitin deacetylase (PgdA/CDA1 family)
MDLQGEPKIAITFDDGFADFYQEALPIIERQKTPVTVFLSAAYIGDENREELLRKHSLNNPSWPVMMNRDQITEAIQSEYVTIGNHTYTHQDLSQDLSIQQIREEVEVNKQVLEQWFGISIDRFSYPFHGFDEQAHKIVKNNHEYVLCRLGLIDRTTTRYRIPRISGYRSKDNLNWGLSSPADLVRRLNYALS